MTTEGRPGITVASDCALDLGVQHGGHVTSVSTDATRPTRHVPAHDAMGTKKLTRVAHETNNRALTKLISHQANEARHCGQRALARKDDMNTILTCTDEASKKDSETSLKDAVAVVAGTEASGCCLCYRLADMRDVSDRDPLYRAVADVEHTRPGRVHIVRPRP